MREELGEAVDAGDASDARVILLRAEGRALCAGHTLAEGTEAQATGLDRDEPFGDYGGRRK